MAYTGYSTQELKMIIGLDVFAKEEYAHTRNHYIKDWIEVCPPDNAQWGPLFGLTGPCEDENVTPAFGCRVTTAIEVTQQEQADASRRWLNNILTR